MLTVLGISGASLGKLLSNGHLLLSPGEQARLHKKFMSLYLAREAAFAPALSV